MVRDGVKKLKPSFVEIIKRSTLLYEHEDTTKDVESNEENVKQIFAELANAPASNQPKLFMQLVHGMRHLKYTSLSNIFWQIGDFNIPGMENQMRKIVLDALPLLKTDSAIALMSDLVMTKAYPAPDSWFSSLAYYKNPTRSMMGSINVSVFLSIGYINWYGF